MSRQERRANDPAVQARKEQHTAASSLGDIVSTGGYNGPSPGGGGGWGLGEKGAVPATGQQPAVNPFIIPKPAGLTVTSQTFPSNYYVEWNLSTWRAACDQCTRMGYPMAYATLVSWVYECSPFVQSLFTALSTPLDATPFYIVDEKGVKLDDWTEELCNKPWLMELRQEILFSQFWGFTGLNFDPVEGRVYKYPMQQLDPINRTLRQSTFNFYDGLRFDEHDNLLFIQPSSNQERMLGHMQSIARSFIQINLNKQSWLAAGRRLAFPILSIGYPQDDQSLDPLGNSLNPYRIQAESIAANIDPTKGVVYPYTLDERGNIVKSIDVAFEKTGTGAKAHDLYNDFNEAEKNEIREMILGGTLTADVGTSGSRALGEVQERKFDTMVASRIEFVLTTLNEKFKDKILRFYKNAPKGIRYEINRAKPMTLKDMETLSAIVTQNGKRLTNDFFEANGIVKNFIEDAPDATAPAAPGAAPKAGNVDKDYNRAEAEQTFFRSQKKKPW